MSQSEESAEMPTAVRTESGTGSAPPAEDEISLLDVLIVILRGRWLIAKTIFGFALIGVIAALVWPSRYTATTVILPPQQSSSAGAALMAQLGGFGSIAGAGLGLKNPSDLQVALLKSQTLEDAVIDRFHLIDRYHAKRRSDARKKLEAILNIESDTKDSLIRISATDSTPQRAADLANGYVEEFIKRSATLAVTEASQRRIFFEQQMLQAKDNLANAEEDLKKTEQTTGLIQLDSQARAVIELVANLRAQIAAKEVQIQGMRSFATGENPDIQMAQQELEGLQAQLAKMGGGADGSSSGVLIPKGNMQQAGLEYVRKLRDVKYYETIFSLLARQYEAAKVDEAREGSMVQIVDHAIAPDHRSWPLRTLLVLSSAAFGLFLGVILVLVHEEWNKLKHNPAERERLDTLRALLPMKKSHGNRP